MARMDYCKVILVKIKVTKNHSRGSIRKVAKEERRLAGHFLSDLYLVKYKLARRESAVEPLGTQWSSGTRFSTV